MPVDLAALQAQHPTWNIVDAIEDPVSGGIWALGRDGGIFALNGAPFMGGMGGSPHFAGRQAQRIEYDAALGGYRIVSTRGEVYGIAGEFSDPSRRPRGGAVGGGNVDAPAAGPAGTAAPTGPSESLSYFLNQMGLAPLINDAWNYFKGLGATASVDDIVPWLRQQPAFKARFPGMAALEQKGEYWTPKQYLEYEGRTKDAMSRAGIPADFWNEPRDFATLIENDWSIDEVEDAVGQAENAVLNLPPAVKQQLADWGLGNGDMIAFWLNEDKGMTLAERKAAQQAATVGAAATRGGLGPLSQAEATELTQTVGVDAAQAGVGRMGALTEAGFFEETAGESMTGEDLDRSTALGAVAGDVTATSGIERRRARRQAQFEGGGGAATGGAGRTGLG